MVVKDNFRYSEMVALRSIASEGHIQRPAGMGGVASLPL